MSGARLLYVVGQGRSGTTALVELLNAHPAIGLGVERYKRLWLTAPEQLTADRFERERFFDFSDGLTNLTPSLDEHWRATYDALAAKWDDLTYRGDKLTTVVIRQLAQATPDARFVCIVRDPADVAHSWKARAANPEDSWPSHNDALRSVAVGNRSRRRIRRAARELPAQTLVLLYDRFFGDPSGAQLRTVLDFLGLPEDPACAEAYAGAHRTYVDLVAAKPRHLTPEERAFVDEHVDWRTWRALRRLAG